MRTATRFNEPYSSIERKSFLKSRQRIDFFAVNSEKKDFDIRVKSILERLRETSSFSKEDVESVLGVDKNTYENIEKNPDLLTLEQAENLAGLFSESVLDIIENTSQGRDKKEKALEKYKQIIANCIKYGADANGKITKIKLAKLVYLSDFLYFYEYQVPMSGMAYKKLSQGPVALELFDLLDALEIDNIAKHEKKNNELLYSLVDENNVPSNLLSRNAIDTIEKVSSVWKNKTTEEIVDFTRSQFTWQIPYNNEVIPYSFIYQEEPTRIFADA
jgi:DNA-binding XRE family transcriptional regulator/uncharacterized phage-associated protein